MWTQSVSWSRRRLHSARAMCSGGQRPSWTTSRRLARGIAGLGPWLPSSGRSGTVETLLGTRTRRSVLRRSVVRMARPTRRKSIVDAMVEWAASNGAPGRVVDPGTGSARFLVAAGRKFRRVPSSALRSRRSARFSRAATLRQRASPTGQRSARAAITTSPRRRSTPRRCTSETRRTSVTIRSRRSGRTGSHEPRARTASRRASSPGSTCISSWRPQLAPRWRLRRLHYVGRVARRELRISRARASPRRARRPRSPRTRADRDGLRRRCHHRRDYLLPRRLATEIDPASSGRRPSSNLASSTEVSWSAASGLSKHVAGRH